MRVPRDRAGRLILAAVVLQVAVPTIALANGVPTRFGFHMYSGKSGLEVQIFDREGELINADLDDFVAGGRTELDWTEVLPERLCSGIARADHVFVRSGDQTRTLQCDDD